MLTKRRALGLLCASRILLLCAAGPDLLTVLIVALPMVALIKNSKFESSCENSFFNVRHHR